MQGQLQDCLPGRRAAVIALQDAQADVDAGQQEGALLAMMQAPGATAEARAAALDAAANGADIDS